MAGKLVNNSSNQFIDISGRRTTLFLTYRGHTLSLSRWATMLGLSRKTLESRIRAGWSLERALRGLAGQGVPNA